MSNATSTIAKGDEVEFAYDHKVITTVRKTATGKVDYTYDSEPKYGVKFVDADGRSEYREFRSDELKKLITEPKMGRIVQLYGTDGTRYIRQPDGWHYLNYSNGTTERNVTPWSELAAAGDNLKVLG